MKKGRKFYENENLIIYVGTAIFFILAISVGIVMYMTTKANSKVGNETGKSITENIENVEDASSNMGKTVEELVEEQGDEKSIIDIAKEVENKIKVAARECNVSVEGYVKELKKADGKDIDEKIANANEEIEGQYMGNNPRQH